MSDPLHGTADGDASQLTTAGGLAKRECPKCGDLFGQIGLHLKHCGGDPDCGFDIVGPVALTDPVARATLAEVGAIYRHRQTARTEGETDLRASCTGDQIATVRVDEVGQTDAAGHLYRIELVEGEL